MNPEAGCGRSPFTILMAEDDPDDQFLMVQAFKELQCKGELQFVQDGEDLMDYLRHQGRYAEELHSARPALIFLDLNMPKKDGREALSEIKTAPDLHNIPIVVWTTSALEEDKMRCLNAGADAYVTKPIGYAALVSTVRDIVSKFRFEKSGKVQE